MAKSKPKVWPHTREELLDMAVKRCFEAEKMPSRRAWTHDSFFDFEELVVVLGKGSWERAESEIQRAWDKARGVEPTKVPEKVAEKVTEKPAESPIEVEPEAKPAHKPKILHEEDLMRQLVAKAREMQAVPTAEAVENDPNMADPANYAYYWRTFDQAARLAATRAGVIKPFALYAMQAKPKVVEKAVEEVKAVEVKAEMIPTTGVEAEVVQPAIEVQKASSDSRKGKRYTMEALRAAMRQIQEYFQITELPSQEQINQAAKELGTPSYTAFFKRLGAKSEWRKALEGPQEPPKAPAEPEEPQESPLELEVQEEPARVQLEQPEQIEQPEEPEQPEPVVIEEEAVVKDGTKEVNLTITALSLEAILNGCKVKLNLKFGTE